MRHTGMRLRTALLALLLAAPLPALLAAPATAAPPATSAAVAKAVPTPGAGWTLVTVDRYGRESSRSLMLLAPTGERTTVLSRRTGGRGPFSLSDWSEDGRTALLSVSSRPESAFVQRVDVTTGAVVQKLVVPRLLSATLDRSGTGILATTYSRRGGGNHLERIGWDGSRTRLTSGQISPYFVPGPAGSVVVSSASGRTYRYLSTVDGTVLNRWRSADYCTPLRWWDQTRILQICGNTQRPLLVDPATSAREPLARKREGSRYGFLDAAPYAGRLYLTSLENCRSRLVVRTADGVLEPVRVPGLRSTQLVGSDAGGLTLVSAPSCRPQVPGYRVVRFDPATGALTTLLELGRREEPSRLLPFGARLASTV